MCRLLQAVSEAEIAALSGLYKWHAMLRLSSVEVGGVRECSLDYENFGEKHIKEPLLDCSNQPQTAEIVQ